MPTPWTLQDAKNKFSQVVEEARRGTPQMVTRRGKPAVVVISAETFETLSRGASETVADFAGFLLSMPTEDNEPDGGESPRPDLGLREVEW